MPGSIATRRPVLSTANMHTIALHPERGTNNATNRPGPTPAQPESANRFDASSELAR